MYWLTRSLRVVSFRWDWVSWPHSMLAMLYELKRICTEKKTYCWFVSSCRLREIKMSGTCSLLSPPGDPWPSCLLPSHFCLCLNYSLKLTSWWPQRCLTSVTNTSIQRFSVYITWLCSLPYKLENKCKWFPLNIEGLLLPLGNDYQKHIFIYTVGTNHSM